MADIRIEVFSGKYNNPDVYFRVINYVYQKDITGGYGYWPPTLESMIDHFQQSYEYSSFDTQQYIWHFIISFSHRNSDQELIRLADCIAYTFASNFQVMYGIESKCNNQHIHFAVNAFSYRRRVYPLTADFMNAHMKRLQSDFIEYYPALITTLQFQKKGNKHVQNK